MFEIIASFALTFLVLAMVGTLAYGALSAAPWVPLRQRDVTRLLSTALVKPGELVVDLGCGDGRVVAQAARRFGARSVGYEIAIVPYALARLRLFVLNLGTAAKVKLHSFWNVPLYDADVVVCFLTPPAMRRLLPKLKHELKPGARFATYAFPLPELVPTAVSKPNKTDASIYLYTFGVRPVNRTVDR